MRRYAWMLLPLLALLNGCPRRQSTPADYDSVRQRAAQSHQGLDQEERSTVH